jgi:hypothetical protein
MSKRNEASIIKVWLPQDKIRDAIRTCVKTASTGEPEGWIGVSVDSKGRICCPRGDDACRSDTDTRVTIYAAVERDICLRNDSDYEIDDGDCPDDMLLDEWRHCMAIERHAAEVANYECDSAVLWKEIVSRLKAIGVGVLGNTEYTKQYRVFVRHRDHNRVRVEAWDRIIVETDDPGMAAILLDDHCCHHHCRGYWTLNIDWLPGWIAHIADGGRHASASIVSE